MAVGVGSQVAEAAARPSRRAAERRLELWNEFMLYLVRLTRRLKLSRHAAETHRRRQINNLFYNNFDPHGVIGIISLRLSRLSPSLKDVNYVIYVSAQVSKKKVPKQAEVMARRLLKKRMPGDTVLVAMVPKGYTRGAWRELKRKGIHLVRTPNELKELFKKYLKKRADRLREVLRGKRIWGDVALVALLLFEILREMRMVSIKDSALIELYDAVVRQRPVELDAVLAGLGPPGAPGSGG